MLQTWRRLIPQVTSQVLRFQGARTLQPLLSKHTPVTVPLRSLRVASLGLQLSGGPVTVPDGGRQGASVTIIATLGFSSGISRKPEPSKLWTGGLSRRQVSLQVQRPPARRPPLCRQATSHIVATATSSDDDETILTGTATALGGQNAAAEPSASWTSNAQQEQELPGDPSAPPDPHWLGMLQQLKAYKQHFGDCLVPRRFWQNIKLGIWASEQRTHFRGQGRGAKKRLPASLHSEKVEMLTDLDFPWKIEERTARWEGNFHELRRYKEEYGNIDVPFKWRDRTYDFNNEFAKWFHAQPTLFSQRRLRVDQVRKLKMVGYDLLNVTGEDVSAAEYADEHDKLGEKDTRVEFDIMFEELQAWKDKYHTTLVPKQVYDNPVLGMWVHRMRRDLKKKLAPQWQVDKLDSIQFAWKVDQISAKWHHNFHEARRYKELHGTGIIPADYINQDEPSFMEASRWLQRNAKLFNKDRLTENRYRLIKEILGVKFVREYDPRGKLTAGATGKALARKRIKGPKVDIAAKPVEIKRPSTYAIGRH